MNETEMSTPFGLLFEEAAPQPQYLVVPTYDEETDFSYVEDSQGHRIPYVEISGVTGTQTETRAQGEKPDADPGDDYVGFAVTGTNTLTAVRAESTDTDPEDDNTRSYKKPTGTNPGDDWEYYTTWRFLAGTETFTKQEKETTDRD